MLQIGGSAPETAQQILVLFLRWFMHVVRTVNGMTRSARKLLGTDGSLYTYTGPLGPLLFLLYINDLPKIIPKYNNIVLFADDTSILITDSNNIDFNINIHQSLTNHLV